MGMFGGSLKKSPFAPPPSYGTPPFVDPTEGQGGMAAPSGMFGSPMSSAPAGGGSQLSALLSQAFGQPGSQQGPQDGSMIAGALARATPAPAPANDQQPGLMSSLMNANLPTAQVDYSAPSTPIDVSKAQVQHPGFFKHGGLGGKILHGLGEFALNYSASQGDQGAIMTLRGRMEHQAEQRRMLQAVRQRQTDRDEWTWREQYKREHPDDQFTQYLTQAGIDPNSRQGQAMYRQRAETMATPPTVAVDGFDEQGNPTKTFMPRAGFAATAPAQASGPPVGTIRNGHRFKGGNPNDRNSWVPVGGASSGGGATFPAVMDALVGQESDGRAGAIGPATRYGRAQGSAQLLPATAKAMAAKLGVAWRPELMTSSDPQAASYQRALGEAYLQEGIAATGNVRDGLRYYHGGPSRKMWGPKTNAYADAVLARTGA
jgi:soluble lytic murein transglycosylase-like protein